MAAAYLFTVAQISNLPYRRFVIGRTWLASGRWQVKNLRYGRLQVCATGAASTLNTYVAPGRHSAEWAADHAAFRCRRRRHNSSPRNKGPTGPEPSPKSELCRPRSGGALAGVAVCRAGAGGGALTLVGVGGCGEGSAAGSVWGPRLATALVRMASSCARTSSCALRSRPVRSALFRAIFQR